MRRIILGLITIIGVGAVIASGATGAFFSDTETSTGNVFAAGAIDLKVDNESYYNGVATSSLSWELDDLPGHLFFNFFDLKPDDEGEDTISLHVENDAWACMDITLTSNDDNSSNEPELESGDAQDIPEDAWDGELAQNIQMFWWADDGDNVYEVGENTISGGVKTLYDLTSDTTPAAGPESVDLLAANGFVIIAETLISDANPAGSTITGDIAIDPAAGSLITGLSCSAVTGTGKIYNDGGYTGGYNFNDACEVVSPVTALAARSAMEAAYLDAAGRAGPDGTNLYAGNLGGQTFAPGLYKWTTGVTIPTDVTLSGSANDIWIFQIDGDLSIASGGSPSGGADVVLTGGAQAKNVFWQVGGPTGATLGTYSTFNGTILSAKQVIIQTGAQLNGRAFAQTQVTLNDNTISVPITTPTSVGAFEVSLADSDENVWDDTGPMPAGVNRYIGKAWCFGTLTLNPVAGDGGVDPTVDPGVLCNGVNLNNETQTDGATLDVQFEAIQARHNPNFLCEPPPVFQACQTPSLAFADTVVGFDQGLRKNGTAVLPDRSNTASVLGVNQSSGLPSDPVVPVGSFFSLGFDENSDDAEGGWITVEFQDNVIVDGPGNDLQVWEVTGGVYPNEHVKIEVSQDGTNWFTAAADLTRDAQADLATSGLAWAKYIRLTDITPPGPFEPTADAYDLDAFSALNCGVETVE